MAPTLKEVNAAAAGPAAARGEITEESNWPLVMSSSDNSNEALFVDSNHAVAGQGASADVAAAAAAPATGDTPPPPRPAATRMTIELENPNKVPPDELAFKFPPHFSPSNPFHRNLSDLDLSMRCTICSELFRAPVTLAPCLHVFCSLCVRNCLKSTYTGMKRKANCPQCNTPVQMPGSSDYEKGILPNKQLEQQVDIYKRCRDELRKKLVRLDVLEKQKVLEICTRSNDQEGMADRKNASGQGKRSGEANEEEQQATPPPKRARKTISNRIYCSLANEVENDSHGEDDSDYVDEIPTSKMPSASSFNHEVAFGKQDEQHQQQQKQVKRKPTISYHGMKRKKLAYLCRTEGLSTQGNEVELRQRHSDFITLYNSECDSKHPRTTRELVKEIKNREASIKTEANNADTKKSNKFMNNLGNSLNAYHEGSIRRPTSGNKEFDSKMNKKFAEMIAKARKRNGWALPDGINNKTVKRNGDARKNDVKGVNDTLISNHEAVEVHTDTSSSQQFACVSQPGCINADACSATASIDSDKTAETAQKVHWANNNYKEKSSLKQKPAVVEQRIISAKVLKSSKSNSGNNTLSPLNTRLASLGPWVCQLCTYENLRNTAKRALCEMCNTPRPEMSGLDLPARGVEVVNIDC